MVSELVVECTVGVGSRILKGGRDVILKGLHRYNIGSKYHLVQLEGAF